MYLELKEKVKVFKKKKAIALVIAIPELDFKTDLSVFPHASTPRDVLKQVEALESINGTLALEFYSLYLHGRLLEDDTKPLVDYGIKVNDIILVKKSPGFIFSLHRSLEDANGSVLIPEPDVDSNTNVDPNIDPNADADGMDKSEETKSLNTIQRRNNRHLLSRYSTIGDLLNEIALLVSHPSMSILLGGNGQQQSSAGFYPSSPLSQSFSSSTIVPAFSTESATTLFALKSIVLDQMGHTFYHNDWQLATCGLEVNVCFHPRQRKPSKC